MCFKASSRINQRKEQIRKLAHAVTVIMWPLSTDTNWKWAGRQRVFELRGSCNVSSLKRLSQRHNSKATAQTAKLMGRRKFSFHSFIWPYKFPQAEMMSSKLSVSVLLLIITVIQVDGTSRLNIPKVLLPLARSTKINFTLETTEGCYRWWVDKPTSVVLHMRTHGQIYCMQCWQFIIAMWCCWKPC